MSYREEFDQDSQVEEQGEPESGLVGGAPAGARQNVSSGASHEAVGRPGGAAQNSGGAIAGNGDELGSGPAREAD